MILMMYMYMCIYEEISMYIKYYLCFKLRGCDIKKDRKKET